MRLDAVLDTMYIVSSIWAGPMNSRVCFSGSSVLSEVVREDIQSPRAAAVTAFLDVNVIPMDTERVLPDQTVLVVDGRIAALGPSGQVPVPAGAVRIDGRNKYLMPGLGDMHRGPFHSIRPPKAGEEQAFADHLFNLYLAHGVTTLRAINGSSSIEVQQLRRIAAEFPVPRMYLARSGIPKLPWSQPDSVAPYIARLKAAGYSHIDADPNITKNGSNLTIGGSNLTSDSLTLMALRHGGLPPTTHAHNAPFAQVLQLGAGGGSVEHLYVFLQTLLGISDSGWQPLKIRPSVDLPLAKVPAVVAALKDAGVWVTPSLRCMELVHPYVKGDGLARVVKALQDGGVKMLLGADAGALEETSVHGELIAMVRAGLTPYQALLTGTRNVAEYFHALDSAGTIAVGKQADLVLLNGNPLQDIRYTREVAGVMIAGLWLDRTVLDQRQLTSPRLWFEALLSPHIPESPWFSKQVLRDMDALTYGISRTAEQWDELEQRGKRVYALVDSLDRTNRQAYARVLPLITTELGSFRTILSPKQREVFDLRLRVWSREQARQGYARTEERSGTS